MLSQIMEAISLGQSVNCDSWWTPLIKIGSHRKPISFIASTGSLTPRLPLILAAYSRRWSKVQRKQSRPFLVTQMSVTSHMWSRAVAEFETNHIRQLRPSRSFTTHPVSLSSWRDERISITNRYTTLESGGIVYSSFRHSSGSAGVRSFFPASILETSGSIRATTWKKATLCWLLSLMPSEESGLFVAWWKHTLVVTV